MISAIGGFLFGYDTGIIGTANLYIYDDLDYNTTLVEEAVVSIALLGAAIGSLFGGHLSDKYGRKFTIYSADVNFAIGSLLMALAPNIWLLMAGRLIVGIGIGLAAMTVPVYIAECSSPDIRGLMVASNVVIITLGQVLAYVIGLSCGSSWRMMFGIGGIPAAVQFLGMLFMPESPRWLIRQNRLEDGIACLLKIRLKEGKINPEKVRNEADKILNELREEGNLSYIGQIKELCSNLKQPFKIGIALMIFQQIDGINTVMYYCPEIMKKAGFATTDREAIVASIPIASMNLLGTILGASLVERLGRRRTLLKTLPALCMTMIGMSLVFLIAEYFTDSELPQVFIVCLVGLYVFIFALGMSSVPWVVNSEIFPVRDI